MINKTNIIRMQGLKTAHGILQNKKAKYYYKYFELYQTPKIMEWAKLRVLKWEFKYLEYEDRKRLIKFVEKKKIQMIFPFCGYPNIKEYFNTNQ